MAEFDTPSGALAALMEIDQDLAKRQNEYEAAAEAWFRMKRDREYKHSIAFMEAQGAMPMRKAAAEKATALIGLDAEARYEALKAVVRVLETRATICQSILKAHTSSSFRPNSSTVSRYEDAIGGRR